MFDQMASWFRKLSFIFVGVGALVAFYTEAFADVPIGRHGKPKPPMSTQRLRYMALIGVGVPGVIWTAVRAARGEKPDEWD